MAVGYQLLHLVEELSLRALVVADDVGISLAHAGDADLCKLLADSAMWSGFSATTVDDITLARIQQRFPDVESDHVASITIGGGAVSVWGVGSSTAPRDAVRHAAEGIARICAGEANVGPVFLEPKSCAPAPAPAPVVTREHGVRWLIGVR
jgi:hypothetical protein